MQEAICSEDKIVQETADSNETKDREKASVFVKPPRLSPATHFVRHNLLMSLPVTNTGNEV